jgi:hypothetical protein
MVGRLNIDPLPVALQLWQQTRSDGELAPMTELQPPNTPEVRQNQVPMRHDVRGDPESALSKNSDERASR